MTPWQRAFTWATAHGITPQEWHDRIGHCLLHGWVHSTPEEFIAFHHYEHNGEPAYFIYIAVGGTGNVVSRFMRYAPRPLPWVVWHRNNEERPRAFAWNKLAKKARI